MRRPFHLFLLILISLFWVGTLFAEEGFVMQKREWKEVYAAASPNSPPVPLSFVQIAEIATGTVPDRLTGKTIEIQGYFEGESENSFRVHQDNYPPFQHCSSCVKKAERESPRVSAPSEALQDLKAGLIRVRGKAKVRPISLETQEPVLEIQAESIAVAEN